MNKSKVLIVDDDRQISEGACMRLQAAGYDTFVARNGAEGIAAACRQRPDVIVLDVRMPVMDGLAALKELKDSPETNKIPVVMLSASIVDEEAALDGGARYFIRKPFAGRSLVEAVDAVTPELNVDVLGSPTACAQSTEELLDVVFAIMAQTDDVLKDVMPAPRPWVLCIDDDRDFSLVLSRRLEAHGISVIHACDGADGFQTAFLQPANAIILDYSMPNGQGDYVLRRLKETPTTENIPVIVLTGNKDASVRQTMLSLGAEAFLYKPPRFEELFAELQRHFDNRFASANADESKCRVRNASHGET